MSYGYGAAGSTVLFVGMSIRNDGPACVLQLPTTIGVGSTGVAVSAIPTWITIEPPSVEIDAGQSVALVLGDSWWIGTFTEGGGTAIPAPRCDGRISAIDTVVVPAATGTFDLHLDTPWREACAAPPSITIAVEPSGVHPFPTPGPAAALEPCRASQLALTPGHRGVGLGTAYLRVFVELVQGPDCSIAQAPVVTLVSADGSVAQVGTIVDPTPITLHDILGYELGWNIGCDMSVPPGPLSARIDFSSTATVLLPIGDFGPSCVDGSQGSLFIEADAP